MKTPKLKPCPFCGGERIEIMSNGIGDFYCICYSGDEENYHCGARSSDCYCESKEQAIDRWNTRKGEIDTRNAALDEAAALFDRKQSEYTPDQRTFNRHMKICKNEILALKQTKG